jgi:hypothetical protein
MLITALSWPEASVRMTLIAAVALVLSVLIWAIFRTGQTAIKKEIRQVEELEKLRARQT